MSRQEFMKELEALLSELPIFEKREALDYYENYFDDAGLDKEQKIIEELISPQMVAVTIKKDLFGEQYENVSYQAKNNEHRNVQNKTDHLYRNLLVGLLLLITFPVWLSILAVIFAMLISVVLLVATFILGGSLLIGLGIWQGVVGAVGVALLLTGCGCVLFGLGLLGIVLSISVGRYFLPWLYRLLTVALHKLFRKKERV